MVQLRLWHGSVSLCDDDRKKGAQLNFMAKRLFMAFRYGWKKMRVCVCVYHIAVPCFPQVAFFHIKMLYSLYLCEWDDSQSSERSGWGCTIGWRNSFVVLFLNRQERRCLESGSGSTRESQHRSSPETVIVWSCKCHPWSQHILQAFFFAVWRAK